MGSDDDSGSFDTHHEDREWEQQRENFRVCYIDKNMTRKDAAEYMKQHFNFNATPRQWERKIKQWGFSKYTARDERLAQIAQAGKSVLDVSRPGRRPRSMLDPYGNLQAQEDRNLRRFARREVSRSRSRSRSASFVDKPRPHFKHEFSDPGSSTTGDPSFNFGSLEQELSRRLGGEGPNMAEAQHARKSSEPVPHNFLHSQDAAGYVTTHESNMPLHPPNQWGRPQSHTLPSFTPSTGQGHFNPYQDDSTAVHASQAADLSSHQAFPGASLEYLMQDPSMSSLPSGFDQYAMASTNIGMHSGHMPENTTTGQELFANNVQLQPDTDPLDHSTFDNNPLITFDIVDMDSSAFPPLPDSGALLPQPLMSIPPQEAMMADNGPLSTDVLPLVEHYTRTVQAITLGASGGQIQHDGLSQQLALDLIQPSQAFMASMSIVLDNFRRTQQRSLQSMKDTCSKLRQKNAMLEQILNGNTTVEPVQPIEHQSRRSSVQHQAPMYGDMYTPNF